LRKELNIWALERIMDSALHGVPGYDRKAVMTLWEEHQAGSSNHSWAIWRWISLSEWLNIFRAGWWRAGPISSPSIQ
jgi:asparagine synthase (glutamine-hydrolysing)